MFKHTPGPWLFFPRRPEKDWPTIVQRKGEGGFAVYGRTLETEIADARLIADAPVMHDLLLRAADAIEALDGTTIKNEKLVDDYRAWRSTVTKATGE